MARQAIIQILDSIACQPVADYLQGILLDQDSALRPVALSVLPRWPLQGTLIDADLWLSVASAEFATDQERSQAARALKKC